MSDHLSTTQEMLIRLEGKVDGIQSTLKANEPYIRSIPVMQDRLQRHKDVLDSHQTTLENIKTEVSTAKGWAAAIGLICGGFFPWLLKKLS